MCTGRGQPKSALRYCRRARNSPVRERPGQFNSGLWRSLFNPAHTVNNIDSVKFQHSPRTRFPFTDSILSRLLYSADIRKSGKPVQGREPVRSSTLIMIAVAAVFGLLAVFVAQSWLNSQAEARLKSLEANQPKAVAAQTLVVASKQLRFGNELTPSVLREVPWPADALPQGGFKTIQEALSGGK